MLGAGFIGQMHSLAMRNAGMSRRVPAVRPELVSIADRNQDLAREVADRYQWQAAVADWSAVLDAELDLFVNAGPNGTHAPACIAAAERGLAVFCEKPLAATSAEAYKLWRAVDALGVEHRAAFMHRFIPAIQLARNLVKAGEIGEVRSFRSSFLLDMDSDEASKSWRFSRGTAGLGAIGDLGSHHIDIARFLVGEVEQVSAVTRTWSSEPIDRNEDGFVAVASLTDGATAVFEASRTAAAHRLSGRWEVDGTLGSVSWQMERLNELMIRTRKHGSSTVVVTRPGDPLDGFWLPSGLQGSHPLGWNECFAHQAHDILGLASGRLQSSVAATFEDGYRVAAVCEAIEESAAQSRSVEVNFQSA